MSVAVTLTNAEVMVAGQVAVMRQVAAQQKGLQDKHGFVGDPWQAHVEGACGEMAAAKAMGVYWSPTVNTFKSGFDVGNWQVRTRSRHDYDLLIRDGDDPSQNYILVTGACPSYRVHGWITGQAARRPEWRQTHGGRPAAWFVPQNALHPIDARAEAA